MTEEGAVAGRFRPAFRLVELANAVRRDPALPRGELALLLQHHGEHPEDVSAQSYGLTERDAVHLRAAVVELTDVLTEPDTDAAAGALNRLLAAHAGPPRLSQHDGHSWHLHVDRHDDAPWAEWFLASGALTLARILGEYGYPAWGECAAGGCTTLYLGTGSGARRRYCSPRCANRARVAAHRRARGTSKGEAGR